MIGDGKFELNLSVPLLFEYEEVCNRLFDDLSLTRQELDAILDYLCQVSHHQKIFFLWRPLLTDPKDDMVLELAVAAGCKYIVSFNERDLRGAEEFGIRVLTPKGFLLEIGELS